MKTMLLSGGDLVPANRDYVMVSGTLKVRQDLRVALLEPLGGDRFHPGWGSSLEDFVAQVGDEDTRIDIEAEVNRVLSNYAAVQRDKVEADISGGEDSRFTTDEILSSVDSVGVQIATDSVLVSIVLRTASGQSVILRETVT